MEMEESLLHPFVANFTAFNGEVIPEIAEILVWIVHSLFSSEILPNNIVDFEIVPG